MRSRISPIVLTTLLLVLASMCAHGWSAGSDTADVTLTIDAYVTVDIQSDVLDFGQSHTASGLPGPGSGEDATFSGGSTTDRWTPTNTIKKYCKGAVGRAPVRVTANGGYRVEVVETSITLDQVGGTHQLPALAQMGKYYSSSGNWQLNQGYDVDWSGTPINDEYYLYACVKREGLADPVGTYTTEVMVQAYTQDW